MVVAAFTAKGVALATRIGDDCFAPERLSGGGVRPMEGGLAGFAAWAFQRYDGLVFVGAVGIAVRAIAPHVKDKSTDPAVVSIDELARHVIPILSGHMGGANALAVNIAKRIGAEAIITTATDLNGVPGVDTWAVSEDMTIENPRAIAPVSAAALEGKTVGVAITERKIDPPFPVTLWLRPRTLTVGIGCRRGVERDHLEECLMDFLARCRVSPLSVAAMASIDAKADEEAILYLSEKYRLPFVTYSAEALSKVEGVFASSDWVMQNMGVDNVCERASVLHTGGRLLMGKTKYQGVTFALSGSEEIL